MLHWLYIALYICYAILFVWLIYRWKFFEITGVNKAHLAFFFLLRASAGLALTLVYTYYYTDQSKADIYRYFNDSKVVSSVLFTNPVAWLKIISGIGTFDAGAFKYLHDTMHFTRPVGDLVTNNSFLIRIISLLNYLSGYNIYIDTLVLDFLGFIGLTILFKALKPYFKGFSAVLYWPVYLLPSFVFWTSGLLKEGVMFIGIALYLSAWLTEPAGRNWKTGVKLLAGFIIVALIKIYVAGVLVLCSILLPFSLFNARPKFAWVTRLALYLFIGFAIWYNVGGSFCEKIIYKRDEFILLSMAEHSGTTLDTGLADPDCNNLVSLLPSALLNAVLKPFVWDSSNLLQLVFAVENSLLILAMLLVLIFCFKLPKGDNRLLALFCFVFALINYLSIGITVPIMGAVVHYRIVATPFLLLSILLMTNLEKLKELLGGYLNIKSKA